MPPKRRLDVALVEAGLARSRERARALILAGRVRVNDNVADKAGQQVREDARVELVGEPDHPYVSRGALKLEGALAVHEAVTLEGVVALDIGASTGGFTDLLLRRGASRVYAVDVGYGQLDWRLRQDSRVVVLERTNARHLTRNEIPEPVDFVTGDVSFISLTKVLPAAVEVAAPGATYLLMVKPQFEVGRELVGKGGVVRDEKVQLGAVAKVRAAAEALGLRSVGEAVPSPVKGPKGNQEYFLRLEGAGAQ